MFFLGQLEPALVARIYGQALRRFVFGLAQHGHDPSGGLVDRQSPRQIVGLAQHRQGRRRDNPHVGNPGLGHAVQGRPVVELTVLGRRDAPIVTLKIDAGPDLQLGVELGAADRVVKDEHVIRVHRVLVGLEPVAGRDCRPAERKMIDDHDLLVVAQVLEDVVPREDRLLVRGPHVGEQHAVVFDHRVPGLAIRSLITPAVGLTGLIEALPVGAEEPAVIRTPNAVVFDATEVQRCAAVTAPRLHEPRCARKVPVQDQVFAKDLDLGRSARGFARSADRLPVATQ